MMERFEQKYVSEPNTGCWLWIGATSPKGYGQFRHGARRVLAHRFSYEYSIGPIPAGLQIDHLCRVRSCVNPSHLEPVTNRENILRGVGLPAVNNRKTECHNGHTFTSENTYTYMGPWEKRRACRKCRVVTNRKYRARIAVQQEVYA
jgi:hypothetical protein